MKLKNFTDMPDAILHKIIDFVDPGLSKDVRVICRPSRKSSRGFSFNKKKEVVIHMPRERSYPYFRDNSYNWKWIRTDDNDKINYSTDIVIKEQGNWKLIKHKKIKSGYLSDLILTTEEDFVMLLAHELRHRWQRRRPLKSLWAYGCQDKRTKFNVERDASVYDKKKVREWRRIYNPKEVYHNLIFDSCVNMNQIPPLLLG